MAEKIVRIYHLNRSWETTVPAIANLYNYYLSLDPATMSITELRESLDAFMRVAPVVLAIQRGSDLCDQEQKLRSIINSVNDPVQRNSALAQLKEILPAVTAAKKEARREICAFAQLIRNAGNNKAQFTQKTIDLIEKTFNLLSVHNNAKSS